MRIRSYFVFHVQLLLLAFGCCRFCGAVGVITSTRFIQDPESIVSNGSMFKLGFFSPSNSSSRCVGIWFNTINEITPVWVANRNKPLNDSSGVLTISKDGKLVVLDGKGEVVWSSNSTGARVGNTSAATLSDDGNLILQDQDNGNILWQSSQNLADTLLGNMRLSTNVKTGKRVQLTSWKSPSDPSVGSFLAGINPSGIAQGFVWKDGVPYWRTPWIGQMYIGASNVNTTYLDGYILSTDKDGTYSFSLSYVDNSSLRNIVMDSKGQLRDRIWNGRKEQWEDNWNSYSSECDVYGKCGEFGFCNPLNSPICSSLSGFEPKNQQEWNGGNWSSGCLGRNQLLCEIIRNGSEAGRKDGFLRMQEVKVPHLAQWTDSLDRASCRQNCLNNCSCLAYSYYYGFGCMEWSSNLIDIQQFSSGTGGADLYLRLAYSEFGQRKEMKAVIIIVLVLGPSILALCAFFSWKWRARHQEDKKRNEADMERNGMRQMKLQDLPVFHIQELITATTTSIRRISSEKGMLSDGSEIAVKRLARSSGQGLEEFMNEVKLISKLQHRNLVRLLGCCVEEEKMLVYEYMPNLSLDAYLFDPQKAELLDWPTRFKIIEGICRGLLYLQRDLRLRIIHRDLKPSNILLDQELNPKISDFGMARIFGGNEDQANTRRVAGTFGYMSPEYAIRGRFSEKSDVFSLGVIILEIVSGKRNTSFRDNEQALSLLGYAWKLWNEDNISALIHSVVSHPRVRDDTCWPAVCAR